MLYSRTVETLSGVRKPGNMKDRDDTTMGPWLRGQPAASAGCVRVAYIQVAFFEWLAMNPCGSYFVFSHRRRISNLVLPVSKSTQRSSRFPPPTYSQSHGNCMLSTWLRKNGSNASVKVEPACYRYSSGDWCPHCSACNTAVWDTYRTQ